jgi:hypothetical protein
MRLRASAVRSLVRTGTLAWLAAGCGDEGNVGYTGARCIGSNITCELPEFTQALEQPLISEFHPGLFTTLTPTWRRDLPKSSFHTLVEGADGTVWTFVRDADESHTWVHQLDADGTELGTQELIAPKEGLHCAITSPVIGGFVTSPGSPGPSFLAVYTSCRGYQLETLEFGASVQEPPMRVLRETFGQFVPPIVTRRPQTSDYAVLAREENTWAPGRLDALGAELRWQQQAIAHEFTGLGNTNPLQPPSEAAALIFTSADALSVVGRFERSIRYFSLSPVPTDFLILFDLDWASGNIHGARQLPFTLELMKSVADSQGRVVIAGSNETGDIRWLRVSGSATSEVTLVRQGYTLQRVHALAADRAGGTYLVTETGERDAATPTLCHMNEAQVVSCALVPDLLTDAWVDRLIAPGDPGVVFALGKDDQLLRYDFPN